MHTFHPRELWGDLAANFLPYGVACRPYESDERISFSYLFPLARPEQSPEALGYRHQQAVSARDILSFGCIEGDFVLQCDAAVFDPQGARSRGFREVGSQANRLAIILNRGEVTSLTGQSAIGEAAMQLRATERADVVVVKDGPNGAFIFTATAIPQLIPAYNSSALYKIGSGDIFSAVFAHEWLGGTEPYKAADLASRHTAAYVESPVLPLFRKLPDRPRRNIAPVSRVVLVGETDTIAKKWLLCILRDTLHHLGTPFVEVVDISQYIQLLDKNDELDGSPSIFFYIDNEQAAKRILSINDIQKGKPVIFIDPHVRSYVRDQIGLRLFYDLSQAVYEICWLPI